MWLKVLMPKGTFLMFCHLLHSIVASKYTWLEVQKYRSAQVQKSLEVHNLQTQMVGYQAKPDSTWHFVTGHRCYSGRSHVPPLSNIVITYPPPPRLLRLSPCPSSLTCPSSVSHCLIVILDSGFAYIQVWKAKFACDWAYHAPTSKYVSYEGFFLSSRILFSALWRWKGDHVVDPLGKSWQHTSASTGGSEPAFDSFRLFSKIFYIHEALVEPAVNSLIIVT